MTWVWCCSDETSSSQLLEQQVREQQRFEVGDIVIYDPLNAYPIDDDEIFGKPGVVLGMNSSMTDIHVLVLSRRFWCYVGDLRRPD